MTIPKSLQSFLEEEVLYDAKDGGAITSALLRAVKTGNFEIVSNDISDTGYGIKVIFATEVSATLSEAELAWAQAKLNDEDIDVEDVLSEEETARRQGLTGPIAIRSGIIERVSDEYRGRTVGEVRAEVAELFRLDDNMIAFAGPTQVGDNYIIDRHIEFFKRVGEKGTGRKLDT